MARNTVLDHQGGNRGLGILGEQDVMSDAESDNDVQVGPGPVQKPGLGNRIAGRLKGIGAHLFFFFQSKLQFVNGAALAADTDRITSYNVCYTKLLRNKTN